MAKILPCPNCGNAKTPTGRDYVIGRAPSSFPLRYGCRGCGSSFTLNPETYHRIPDATEDELEEAVGKQDKSVHQANRFVEREVGRR